MIETTLRLLRTLGVRGALLALFRFFVSSLLTPFGLFAGGRGVRDLLELLRVPALPPRPRGLPLLPFEGAPDSFLGPAVTAAGESFPLALLALLYLSSIGVAGGVARGTREAQRSWRVRAAVLGCAAWVGSALLASKGSWAAAALFPFGLLALFYRSAVARALARQAELERPWRLRAALLVGVAWVAFTLVALAVDTLPSLAVAAGLLLVSARWLSLVPAMLVLSPRGVRAATREAVALAHREPRRAFLAAAVPILALVGGVGSLTNPLLPALVGRDAATSVGEIVLLACAFGATYVGGVAATAAVLERETRPGALRRLSGGEG